MFRGSLASILLAPAAAAPMRAVEAVRAVAGQGLEGDRYFLKQGTFFKEKPDYEVTLIEADAVEAIRGGLASQRSPRAGSASRWAVERRSRRARSGPGSAGFVIAAAGSASDCDRATRRTRCQ